MLYKKSNYVKKNCVKRLCMARPGFAKVFLFLQCKCSSRALYQTPIFITTFCGHKPVIVYLVTPYCHLFKFSIYYVIIMIMKSSPFALTKQKLSRKAAAAKKARDIAAAKTPARRAKKAENQRLGQNSNSDLHHTKSGSVKRVSIRNNRGNFGNGTRNE